MDEYAQTGGYEMPESPVPSMPGATEMLADEIDRLANTIERLETRSASALRSPAGVNASEPKPEPSSPLRGLHARLANQVNRLNDLTERLDL